MDEPSPSSSITLVLTAEPHPLPSGHFPTDPCHAEASVDPNSAPDEDEDPDPDADSAAAYASVRPLVLAALRALEGFLAAPVARADLAAGFFFRDEDVGKNVSLTHRCIDVLQAQCGAYGPWSDEALQG